MDSNNFIFYIYYNEDTKSPIYEGDVQFKNLSPFDVVFDTNKEDTHHDWVLCRSFKIDITFFSFFSASS